MHPSPRRGLNAYCGGEPYSGKVQDAGQSIATVRFLDWRLRTNFLWEAIVKSRLLVAWLAFCASDAWADCPNVIRARSGLPGRFGEWTTTYDLTNGTLESRHITGAIITGNVKATCTGQVIVLEEFNTRACPQLRRMIAETSWTAARKFRASLS
jgi:hypothetical protein